MGGGVLVHKAALLIEQAGVCPAHGHFRRDVSDAQRRLRTAKTRRCRSRYLDEPKLLERGHAVVQPDFLDDLAVFEPKPGVWRQGF